MKNLFIIFISIIALSGCMKQVEVPPAWVGKIMTKDGYKEGAIPPSRFRLDPCIMYCDRLVLVESSVKTFYEEFAIFMPKDKLNMGAHVGLTMAINSQKYDELFTRISPKTVKDEQLVIDWNTAYLTYAKQMVRAEVQEILSKYTISEIASSRDAINIELHKKLAEKINADTPFIVRYAALAKVDYPELILKAQEAAAERREAIQKEEAQLEINKVQQERKMQEQRMARAIDVEKAQAEAEVNRILAQSITPQYIKYRELNVLESLSTSNNKVFIPAKMLDSVAGQVMVGNQ